MILSVSRRTDIPAFYSDWFFKQLDQGFVLVPNPIAHEKIAKIAEEILTNLKYPQDKKERVVNCVLHHRSSRNAENIEELCVCDADILAHFDNIPNAFVVGVKKHNFSKPEQFKAWLEKDFNDLSDRTKEAFKAKYENIMQVLFGENWRSL